MSFHSMFDPSDRTPILLDPFAASDALIRSLQTAKRFNLELEPTFLIDADSDQLIPTPPERDLTPEEVAALKELHFEASSVNRRGDVFEVNWVIIQAPVRAKRLKAFCTCDWHLEPDLDLDDRERYPVKLCVHISAAMLWYAPEQLTRELAVREAATEKRRQARERGTAMTVMEKMRLAQQQRG